MVYAFFCQFQDWEGQTGRKTIAGAGSGIPPQQGYGKNTFWNGSLQQAPDGSSGISPSANQQNEI
jgi:hypothetical protein